MGAYSSLAVRGQRGQLSTPICCLQAGDACAIIMDAVARWPMDYLSIGDIKQINYHGGVSARIVGAGTSQGP